MCGSTVDIQSVTTDNRRGKKGRRKKQQWQNIMSCPQGGHNKTNDRIGHNQQMTTKNCNDSVVIACQNFPTFKAEMIQSYIQAVLFHSNWNVAVSHWLLSELGIQRVQACNRASTSKYSLTFCIRVMLPEHHQWMPAVQAATVVLRTPPVDSQSPASRAHTPPSVHTMSSYRGMDASL